MKSYKDVFVSFVETLQDEICSALEKQDGASTFIEEKWKRDGGGGGRTRVLSGEGAIEKGGVNVSVVHGDLPRAIKENFNTPHNRFFAAGISLVIHPFNPFAPTVHANYRYFEMYDENGEVVDQWFGGGADLTPYYLFEEDAAYFHKEQKNACDAFNAELYPLYKKACDDYFFNSHRQEARGIGGLFFDYLKKDERHTTDFYHNLVVALGRTFVRSYVPILEKRKNSPFDPRHKEWQEIRRGRYVEFNLLHDKGTLFGLKTNGRIESILMTLPPTVRWVYNHSPKEGSEEERLLRVLKSPKDWA